jgi:hypothetical protein
MSTQIHLLEKIAQVKALLSDIEALLAGGPVSDDKPLRIGYLVDSKDLLNIYPREAELVRWVTCAKLCEEMEIESTRGNCSSIGCTLKKAGFPRRRSQGKVLYNLPACPAMY